MNAAKFTNGQVVKYRADDGAEEVGAILNVKNDKQRWRYNVLMLSGRTREFEESELKHG
jgi:hypothetical protein